MTKEQFQNAVWGMYGNNTISHAWELYRKSQHALWIARAMRANSAKSVVAMYEYNAKHLKSQYNNLAYNAGKVWEDRWERVELLCREKAKEYE